MSPAPKMRAKSGQQALFQMWNRDRFAFGGSKLKRSHAKTSRPFSRKLPIHIILKSSEARGSQSLLKHFSAINEIVFQEAERRHVKLQGSANAGNHLHLLVQAPSKDRLSAFLRAVSGRIAMCATGARKGQPRQYAQRLDSSELQTSKYPVTRTARTTGGAHGSFWDQRPFSRIVAAGRDTLNVLRYLTMNSTESLGLSRSHVRALFAELKLATEQSTLMRAPRLDAIGFA